MNREMFMRAFGNETTLRCLYALHLKGESSLYRIFKILGLSPTGWNRGRIRENLENLAALGILQTRTIQQFAEGTVLSDHPHISQSHVEYRLDNAHEVMPSLRALFEQIRLNGETRLG
jgi:hypothetical protein